MSEYEEYQRMALLELLNRSWTPHNGQEKVGRILFDSPADMIYVECGRKFGKTEFAVYCCWLYALLNPNAEVYYLGPLVKQAKELVWANYRMQSCCTYTQDFLKEIEKIMGGKVKVYHHEMRIVLPNGSFIKVDGSDNVESQRGLKPNFIAIDEYRDSKKEWLEAVRPNMSVKKGKILFVTTPPHTPNHAYHMAQECKQGMEEGDEHYYYMNMPSYTNNRIPGHKEWLAREEARLRRLGRYNEWRREYMAEFLPENEKAVIPQLNRDVLQSHDVVLSPIRASQNRQEMYVIMDPGNSATMAALFAFYDPYKAILTLVDCIHQEDASKTSAGVIWPLVAEKLAEYSGLYEGAAHIFINPKTPWFGRDLYEQYNVASAPLPKIVNNHVYNIGMIKDILAAKQMHISERCTPLITEAELFQKYGDDGRIPLMDQKQLINCLRFLVCACGYTTEKLAQPVNMPADENWIDKMIKAPRADERVAEILAAEHGILMDDDDDFMFIDEYDNFFY